MSPHPITHHPQLRRAHRPHHTGQHPINGPHRGDPHILNQRHHLAQMLARHLGHPPCAMPPVPQHLDETDDTPAYAVRPIVRAEEMK